MNAPLFILSGASGAGKTTHALQLLKDFNNLHRIITYTTRQPRPGEVDGVDYMFVSKNKFTLLEQCRMFIETNHYGDKWYGTHAELIKRLQKGQACLVIPDVNGAIEIIKRVPDAITIWLTVPEEVLESRLKKRGTESPYMIRKRLSTARKENEKAASSRLYQHIVETSDFQTAYDALTTILKNSLTA